MQANAALYRIRALVAASGAILGGCGKGHFPSPADASNRLEAYVLTAAPASAREERRMAAGSVDGISVDDPLRVLRSVGDDAWRFSQTVSLGSTSLDGRWVAVWTANHVLVVDVATGQPRHAFALPSVWSIERGNSIVTAAIDPAQTRVAALAESGVCASAGGRARRIRAAGPAGAQGGTCPVTALEQPSSPPSPSASRPASLSSTLASSRASWRRTPLPTPPIAPEPRRSHTPLAPRTRSLPSACL
jgi:hypothetical protein